MRIEKSMADTQAASRRYVRGLLKGSIIPEPGRQAQARRILAQIRGKMVTQSQGLAAEHRELNEAEAAIAAAEQEMDALGL